jgi:hypothetical protein
MTTHAFTIFDAGTGAIRRMGVATDDQLQGQCGDDELIIDGHYSGVYWDVRQKQLVDIPESPGGVYRWDPQAHAWLDPRTAEDLRAMHLAAIEGERDRRITVTPIVYDGANLAADAESIERLSKKLATTGIQIARGETPPAETLVWRDADNAMHAFQDLQAYRTWLEGFALALDARGMQAFAWSWEKKAAVLALGDDLVALREFDPTAG